MRNAWLEAFQADEGFEHFNYSFLYPNSLGLVAVEWLLSKISCRKYKDSTFRIPKLLNSSAEATVCEYYLELTLAQAFIRSIAAISKKESVLNFKIIIKSEDENRVVEGSVSNSGKLLEGAFKLYDQQFCQTIALQKGFKFEQKQYLGETYPEKFRPLGLLKMIKVRIASKVKVALQNLMGRKLTWKSGFLKNVELLGQIENWKELPDAFAADPFITDFQGSVYIFTEGMSGGKGQIEVRSIDEGQIGETKVALIEDFHLSFPFIYKENDLIFMCPETSKINEIRLYKSENLPNGWILFRTLIKEINAVDSILFKISDTYYLLTNLSLGLVECFDSTLWLFESKSLDSDNWVATINNPVISSAKKSRNGGYFRHEDKHYRVNQVTNFGEYGSGVEINEISMKNQRYSESTIDSHVGGYAKSHYGNHHLSKTSEYTVFDFAELSKTRNI